ncbi:MAG: enhanced serine sensitivity protein SseB C-terminal domain-containing protein [Pyrinomonadaceae bacterium]|nr:enhanced serine sensitivity protein SseB C-terminal domain-containing protein [Pyrinomonadaceae bacterium]
MSSEKLPEFVPANELERLFAAATIDPTQRPRFYRDLLDGEVFFLAIYDEIGIRIQTAMQDEKEVVPLFTSPGLLESFARGVGMEDFRYEHGNGREVLTILDGARIVLNANAAYAKDFEPDEVRRILDGSEMKRLKIISLAPDAPLLLSQPAHYPQEMIEDLKASFAFHNWVEVAYLAQAHQPEKRQLPQFIIAISDDENYDPKEAAEIAQESLGEDEFLTFIKLNGDIISNYVRENVEPFYQRAKH